MCTSTRSLNAAVLLEACRWCEASSRFHSLTRLDVLPPQTNRGGGGAPGAGGKQLLRLPSGRARIRLLYEEYVHLPMLRQVSPD